MQGTSLTVAALDGAGFAVALDPAHARGDDARRARARAARQPRGRRARQVRRAAADRHGVACPDGRHDTVCRHRGGDRGDPGGSRASSSSTTPTARTRATSSSPPSSRRPETINFMATHGRGLICLCLTEERADQLGLPLDDRANEAPLGTAFTVGDRRPRGHHHRHLGRRPQPHDPGRDRAGREARRPAQAAGTCTPLRAKPGGVLERIGQTGGCGRPRPARRAQPGRAWSARS